MQRSNRPDAATIRTLAVRASVDPRTIIRLLDGATVRGMPGHRARAVLVEAGLLAPQAPPAGGRP